MYSPGQNKIRAKLGSNTGYLLSITHKITACLFCTYTIIHIIISSKRTLELNNFNVLNEVVLV